MDLKERMHQLEVDVENIETEKIHFIKKAWDWFYDNIYWKTIGWRLKEFRSSVNKLIRWLPIIWKDRDWDDHYIWELMKNKLRWQAKYIGDRDFHTRAAHDAKRMRLCANLIDKIQDEWYQMEHTDYYEANFNWLDVENKPEYKELDIQTTFEDFDSYFKKHKSVYKKVLSDKKYQVFPIEEREGDRPSDFKLRIAMNIGHYNHNRARKLLFKIMEEDIEGWWD